MEQRITGKICDMYKSCSLFSQISTFHSLDCEFTSLMEIRLQMVVWPLADHEVAILEIQVD